jgi:mono/diheme cytochrome c family protein
MLGNIPATVSTAKPMMTPEPDPFPARPTPTVVINKGKIVQQWQAPADAAQLVNPVKDKPDAAKLGREYYMQRCADCHGKKGEGNGWMSGNSKRDGKPLPPTNLTSQMVQANTDGELFWKITNGRSPMPANRIRFDDERRWYIVTFLRTLKR